ncbi:phage tail sheath family protein [Pseudonocardia charpentierae]|uniref:Phage tail sheath subtilisin-like domain-containing protein n=1 Tax=Pseudonocardia charpentierae TaxID=3075545 RepID=A0ABU2NI40_9PSEU|nr:phage tail sheath subtilisin-like domain-containing protein [Pseudonocardia sp. DSM 45834]MDT0353128.1 phage tail sheath subtilisin-like domain-containing protein [Pseudonocardia sp. DSM 45834]
MVNLTAPGVYIDEKVATGPIAGVGTSAVGFLGATADGPIGEPTLITDMARFTARFAAPVATEPEQLNLARAVAGFFDNGGTVAFVTRVGTTALRASAELKGGTPARTVLNVTARRAGAGGNKIKVEVTRPAAADDPHFALVVTGPVDGQTETFENLSMDPADPRFVGSVLQDAPVEVTLADPDERDSPAKAGATALKDGADAQAGDDAKAWTAALGALAKVDEVSIVCAPGVTTPDVQRALIDHCEITTQDRFAVLDAEKGAPAAAVLTQRARLESPRGFAALYHPWLSVPNPARRGKTIAVPPSGHVAGIFTRVDAQRGVHKAPANELVAGALGLEAVLDDVEHGRLNDRGVNVLRVFAGRSTPTVWGARTTSNNTDWRYVNVRRLFLFIEESIQEGIRWAVFEPNDLSLWKRLDRTITEFLTRVWSSGALFGATAAEAFYVKVDQSNNPDPELGQVVVEVGVAPVRPAEFVVVQIGIWAGGGQVQEG